MRKKRSEDDWLKEPVSLQERLHGLQNWGGYPYPSNTFDVYMDDFNGDYYLDSFTELDFNEVDEDD